MQPLLQSLGNYGTFFARCFSCCTIIILVQFAPLSRMVLQVETVGKPMVGDCFASHSSSFVRNIDQSLLLNQSLRRFVVTNRFFGPYGWMFWTWMIVLGVFPLLEFIPTIRQSRLTMMLLSMVVIGFPIHNAYGYGGSATCNREADQHSVAIKLPFARDLRQKITCATECMVPTVKSVPTIKHGLQITVATLIKCR